MRARLASLSAHAALAAAAAIALYPVLWVVRAALTPGDVLEPSPLPLPREATGDHFAAILQAAFGRQLANSLAVAGATTGLGLGLSLTAAWAFSRLRFPGRDAGLGALVLTQIFPGVVGVIPLYVLLDRLALLDSLAGLVLVYSSTAVPFCTWMLKGYFDTLPRELEDAARVDGATEWTIFARIALPLARPAIAVTALFCFMTAWNEFVLAATLINDAARFTAPVAVQRFVGEYRTEWGRFAAASLVTSAPVIALFYALQRHLVGGLTAGSVKG